MMLIVEIAPSLSMVLYTQFIQAILPVPLQLLYSCHSSAAVRMPQESPWHSRADFCEEANSPWRPSLGLLVVGVRPSRVVVAARELIKDALHRPEALVNAFLTSRGSAAELTLSNCPS